MTDEIQQTLAGWLATYDAPETCVASGLADGLNLRRASSAGEPLTPDVVAWGREALGVEVRDHYGQTEHGMLIGNWWRCCGSPAIGASDPSRSRAC